MKYVFEVKVKPDHTIEEYVEAWKAGSAIIQKEPGARGTRLHRKIDEDNTLIAIAEWDSKEARDRAMARLRDESDEETRKILTKHRELANITVIGNFEESEWSVLPEGQTAQPEIK